MKNLFLFLSISILSLSISSCSSDDNNSTENGDNNPSTETGGTVSFKVDGVQKTFNNIIIDKTIYDEGKQEEAIYLEITASEEGNSEEYITFQLFEGSVGANKTYVDGWDYRVNNKMYHAWHHSTGNGITDIVQINDAEKLKATFSGTLTSNVPVSLNITEGFIDINR